MCWIIPWRKFLWFQLSEKLFICISVSFGSQENISPICSCTVTFSFGVSQHSKLWWFLLFFMVIPFALQVASAEKMRAFSLAIIRDVYICLLIRLFHSDCPIIVLHESIFFISVCQSATKLLFVFLFALWILIPNTKMFSEMLEYWKCWQIV